MGSSQPIPKESVYRIQEGISNGLGERILYWTEKFQVSPGDNQPWKDTFWWKKKKLTVTVGKWHA